MGELAVINKKNNEEKGTISQNAVPKFDSSLAD